VPGKYALDIAVAVKSAAASGPDIVMFSLIIVLTAELVTKEPVATLPLLNVTSLRYHVICAEARVANPRASPAMVNSIASFLKICILTS
jgi:hypothetical protein